MTMRPPRARAAATLLVALVAVLATALVNVAGVPASVAAAPPVHSVAVGGVGIAMYPAFDPTITRYAVTSAGAVGSVTVTATTDDPAGSVRVNGRPVDGPAVVSGLAPGDEISVLIDDAGGAAAYSLFVAPAGFPTLTTLQTPGLTPRLFALTLTQWNQPTANYETIVDRRGVPVYARASFGQVADLKRSANGSLTVMRRSDSKWTLHELNDDLTERRTWSTPDPAGLDNHDSQLLPNGNRLVMLYQRDGDLEHAVIQELTAAGKQVFRWSSKPYQSYSYISPDGDYAHINSLQLTADGHILASFRNFNSAWKIARRAKDGYAKGEVIWRFGGRNSDVTFPDDPHHGPCAQHTVYQQPGGNLTVFDNGSTSFCPDGAGGTVARQTTRATEYSLDLKAGTASLVRSWDLGWFAVFGGSTQRLGNGNLLTGWASMPYRAAAETEPDGDEVWWLKDASAQLFGVYYSTYRVSALSLPDVIEPEVSVTSPAPGTRVAVGAPLLADYSCADRGGSTLRTCVGPVLPGETLDTSRYGTFPVPITATDGRGNTGTASGTYDVTGPVVPDARIVRGTTARGAGIIGGAAGQTVQVALAPKKSATATVVVRNFGTEPASFAVRGTAGTKAFPVAYRVGTKVVTASVRAGTWTTPLLGPGATTRLTVQVTRAASAKKGATRTVTVQVGGLDNVAVKATAR